MDRLPPRRALRAPARSLALAVCVALAVVLGGALAGCGLGAGPVPSAVRLLVTRDFGSRVLSHSDTPTLAGEETVISLLKRNDHVQTRFGGGFVQSINGLAGGHEGGQQVDWFYYVNGVQATRGAASTRVHAGDRVWWDHHDWSQTPDVPAVVGSFPEPFLHGLDGKRLPVRVDCVDVAGFACQTVAARLQAQSVPAAVAGFGGGGPLTLRVLVGTWATLGQGASVQTIAQGPGASGVYARISANGRTLMLLDQNGRVARSLQAGAGLIAATRHGEDAPVWVVTGTDAAGVSLAASAFRAAVLRGRFAVAVTSSQSLALPVAGG